MWGSLDQSLDAMLELRTDLQTAGKAYITRRGRWKTVCARRRLISASGRPLNFTVSYESFACNRVLESATV